MLAKDVTVFNRPSNRHTFRPPFIPINSGGFASGRLSGFQQTLAWYPSINLLEIEYRGE